jgi:predicted ATP-grasp superfamily ATP-dependent carboligase
MPQHGEHPGMPGSQGVHVPADVLGRPAVKAGGLASQGPARGTGDKPAIAVVGASARLLVRAAVDEGLEAYALDLFGDADTRALALGWWYVGRPACGAIDPAQLRAALQAAQACAQASGRRLLGWIPCAPLECEPALLAEVAAALPGLPLLGSRPAAVQRLRDPLHFFSDLRAAGIPHPEVGWQRPADGQAWLLKNLRSCGGEHIRLLSATQPVPALRPGQYLQRRAAGQPMSATFVVHAGRSRLLGFNRQVVEAAAPGRAASPYRFLGVVGPVPVPAKVAQQVQLACERLAAQGAPLGLRGLASLDFLLQGDSWQALELNPRPPASTTLYPGQHPVRLHLAACLEIPRDAGLGFDVGTSEPASMPAPLPEARPGSAGPGSPRTRGWAIVHARQGCALTASMAAWLGAQPATHDLPLAGQRFSPGQPLCSVSAAGDNAQQVLSALSARREALLQQLETPPL